MAEEREQTITTDGAGALETDGLVEDACVESDLDVRVARLERELEAKAAEADEHRDRFLRERAELENFKKRMQREKSEALRYANEALLRELLPVIDNLERALAHAPSDTDSESLAHGVRLVLKGALDVLERHGVLRIEAEGEPFDPTVHEAVASVPCDDVERNRVVEQMLPGYRLHERLLRPAQVAVSVSASVENTTEHD